MTDFRQTSYVGSGGGAQVLPMWAVITECTYLIPHLHISSVANNKKVKYPEFCMGYID